MTHQPTTKDSPTHLKTKGIRLGVLTTVSLGIISLISLPSVRAFPAQVSNFIPTVTVNVPSFESLWQSVLPNLIQTLGDIPGLNQVGALGLPDRDYYLANDKKDIKFNP